MGDPSLDPLPHWYGMWVSQMAPESLGCLSTKINSQSSGWKIIHELMSFSGLWNPHLANIGLWHWNCNLEFTLLNLLVGTSELLVGIMWMWIVIWRQICRNCRKLWILEEISCHSNSSIWMKCFVLGTNVWIDFNNLEIKSVAWLKTVMKHSVGTTLQDIIETFCYFPQ